ncbi:unnamed protein product [Bursaphelenchus okinawaensis]|uniref:Long-chain-fatty-acid--CoA ligase n=1 Tax=Bursaphelenchus okinawaensis TaxID=465554 RepID=A0A811KYA7_9BILA|nr:unnamed protein product [Bursaphelenchus okinawaensis]CAG9113687.1 unnamed protein product [Bursaphelenchus okinawaensis]
MVKDAASSLWVVPLNVGSRVADLSELAANGTHAQLVNALSSAPSSVYYSVGAAATIGAMGLWWMWSKEGKVKPILDFNSQTRKLNDGSRVSTYVKSDNLFKVLHSDVTTIYEASRRGAKVSKNGRMLGYRKKQVDGSEPYVWLHYDEVLKRADDVSLALRQYELPAGQETFVGIYSKNRPEWVIVEQATYNFNNVLVPLYDTLGPDACSFIVNQAEIKIVFCDAVSKAMGLLKQKSSCPSLSIIVVFDADLKPEQIAQAESEGVKLVSFTEFEATGAKSDRKEHQPPKPADLSTLCYTSGTTGTPKGVMLTHGNIIADGTTLDYFKNFNVSPDDCMMSFLPLAHMFERVVQSVVYTVGGRVGFFRGDIKHLADDIKTLRPTVLPVVPRVLNRIYDKVMSEVNKSKVKKMLFETALAFKQREINSGIVRSTSFFDQVVFKKIREGMGGRVRMMITGSAPLAENVLNFVRCVFGAFVVEGYGQTECVACATITVEGDAVPGHVGVPSPCCAIKLVDVPELGYFAKNDAGEVCIRGPNVFKGYYKNEAQTKETIDEEGWLHTGDIGKWTERGTLKIVDRKKHIFKLAQGEYVAPEKIENIYSRSGFVAQSFVHGESLKTCLVAIVVPDPDVLPKEADVKLGLTNLSMEELCKNKDVKKMILDDMHKIGKESGLFSFEQVKDIYLFHELFSVENGLLTPTLKSKRPQLKEHFKPQIEDMYSRLD